MSTVDLASARRRALWVVIGQVIVAAAGALFCYARWGAFSSRSALIGGVIGVVATLAQVLVGLRGEGTGLVGGTAAKLVVTVVLLVLAIRFWRIVPGPLYMTYVITFLVYWLGLARMLRARAQAG